MGYADYEEKLNRCIYIAGFYTSFSHWRWVSENEFALHLSKIRELTNGVDIYAAYYGELAEYYYLKDAIDSISIANNIVTINYTKKDVTRPYSNITTLLWVNVNLKGTSLEGLFIQATGTTQIIDKGNDLYVIGVDLDFANTTLDITLSSATNGNHYNNETIPVVSVNTSTRVITTDQPIKYTLFSKLKAEDEWEVDIEEFNHTISSSHTLATSLNTVTHDYYLGFSNEFKQTGLYRF